MDSGALWSARPRRVISGIVLSAVAAGSWILFFALLAAERDRSVDTLLERDLNTLAVSWSAVQSLQRNSVLTYFQEYVQEPHTLGLLRVAQDPEGRDLARLHLFRHLSPVYERLLERGVRQFHFHLPNSESFLRFHHPARFGDSLLGVRESIRVVNERLEPVFGFEVGRVVSGYRSVFPIVDEHGEHLGSVELSMPFKVFLEELQHLMPEHSMQLLLHAERQREILFDEQQGLYEAWPGSNAFLIEDPHQLRQDSPPPLPAEISRLVHAISLRPGLIERMLDETRQAFQVQAEGRHYAVMQVPVVDPGEALVGLLVAYLEEPELGAIQRAFQSRVVAMTVALLALFTALFFLFRTLDQRLAERKRLWTVSETLGQGLYLTDARNRIISMNPHARMLLGYSDQEVQGRSAHDLFHRHAGNAFLEQHACPIIHAVRGGREYRGEDVFQRADGSLVDVMVVARSLHDQNGHAGTVTVFDDIGVRKQAERELADSRQRLENILWGTGVGTWEWNVQTGETRFNARWAEIVGFRLEELEPINIGTWMRFRHPEDEAVSAAALQRHFDGEASHYDAEVRMRHRDGHDVWVQDRGRVITRTADGEPEWMAGTHLDISARKRAEHRSQELLERLRKLAAELPGFVYQYQLWPDGTSSFVYASSGIQAIYGVSAERVVADASEVFAVLHPGDFERVAESIRLSAERLSPWHETYRVNHPEKGMIWVEGHSTPERLTDGSTIWHGYIHDVTQRRKAEQKLESSEAKYRTLVENSPVIIYRSEPEPPWRMLHVSQGAERLCGYSSNRLVTGSPGWGDIVHPDDLEALSRTIGEAVAASIRFDCEYRILHADGMLRWVHEVGMPHQDGQVLCLDGVISDITARKRAEQAAAEAQKLLEVALENSPSGILIADAPDGRIRFANRAALAMGVGAAEEPLPLTGIKFAHHAVRWNVLRPDGEPMPASDLPLTRAIVRGETVEAEEAIIVAEDGRQHWVSVSAAPIVDSGGKVTAGIVVFSDIAQQKNAQWQLQRSAHHDALTGLPNRVLLADRLEQAMARARRAGGRLAVVFIDLDHFKPVNDTYGHGVGDQLLIQLARRMSATLRDADTLARIGGDEFLAVLSDLSGENDAQALMNRLLEALRAPVELDGLRLQVSGSIGVTFYPQNEELDPEQLLRQADAAMYNAKLQGRNAWRAFPVDGHEHAQSIDKEKRPPAEGGGV